MQKTIWSINSQLTPYSLCFAHLTIFIFLRFCLLVVHNYIKQRLLTQQQKLIKKNSWKKKSILLLTLFVFVFFNDFHCVFWKLFTRNKTLRLTFHRPSQHVHRLFLTTCKLSWFSPGQEISDFFYIKHIYITFYIIAFPW